MNAIAEWYRRGRSLLLVSLLGLLPSLAAPGGAWAQGAASADLVARGKYVFGRRAAAAATPKRTGR
jgi:hypothetical protein